MFDIIKQFDFCYGHRVHSQRLNKTLSKGAKEKCRFWHGHNGSIKLYLSSKELDRQSMVTDFNNLNFFKDIINEVLDHKFIIDCNDPLFELFVVKNVAVDYWEEWMKVFKYRDDLFCWTFGADPKDYQKIIDLVEGLVIVDFVPTSEKLSEWIYKIVATHLAKELGEQGTRLLTAVEFFETPKSSSIYRPDNK